MNINFEKVGNVQGKLTLQITKSDYEDDVKKSLKKFCQVAQVPGFRPGHVPVSLAKKMYGGQAKVEAVRNIMSNKMTEYIHENKINMLGMPITSKEDKGQDIEALDDLEFIFDVALAPEFTVSLSADDHVKYYDIQVSDEEIDAQVKQMANQGGHHESVDTYEDRDLLRGTLAELDENGQPKEGGVQVEASVMPFMFKDEEQKALFAGAAKNSVITFNPSKAHGNNDVEMASLLKVTKEEAANYHGDFSFEITEISRFVPAELNTEFFDMVLGKDVVKTEEEFRNKIKERLAGSYASNSDFKFLQDLRKYLEDKVGTLEFPDELLKRIMLINNPDKDEKFVEDNYPKSIEELRWHLIKEQLVQAYDIKVSDDDLKTKAREFARFQLMQYGIPEHVEGILDELTKNMLEKPGAIDNMTNACIEDKLKSAAKNVVTLDHEEVTMEAFNKLFEEQK